MAQAVRVRNSTDVYTTVTSVVRGTPKDCFATASSTKTLAQIFPGTLIIPGVVSAEMADGAPQSVGATRLVKTNDGNVVAETYTQWEPSSAYAYEMSKLKAPLSWILVKATGAWTFADNANGTTTVTWTYTGDPTGGCGRMLAGWLIRGPLRKAMIICASRVKDLVEAAAQADAPGDRA